MSCSNCDPSFEDRLRQMLRQVRRIPGVQSSWKEIQRADEDWAEVGRMANSLLDDLFGILIDELVSVDKVAEAIYESEPGVKNWVDWKEIVSDPDNAELLKKYMNYARGAVYWGIK